ncbi:MAG: hypothetical protein E6R03_03685 [Hyphomicrobiaceae bacterium]|nr:MAG: hypothetical protein E6R03_03685 [Hyphomicrobiaceae bacterium]
MTSKSKGKGNSHERDVAEKLSNWYGSKFLRIPNSGALRWGGAAWVYGDLLPPEDFPFVMECKHYAEIVFEEVLGTSQSPSGCSRVSEWWFTQAVPDAERAFKDTGKLVLPLLFWKADYRPIRMSMGAQEFLKLPGASTKLVSVLTSIPHRAPFVTVNLEEFLAVVSPQQMRELVL